MSQSELYLLAADVILLLHFSIVLFVIFSLIFILIGQWRNWVWVINPWFRTIHLLAIGIVLLQSWLGEICFLTAWEMTLREQAGDAVYAGAFIAHWVETLLYYQAPSWVFTLCYTIFGVIVIFSWFWVKPRFHSIE